MVVMVAMVKIARSQTDLEQALILFWLGGLMRAKWRHLGMQGFLFGGFTKILTTDQVQ